MTTEWYEPPALPDPDVPVYAKGGLIGNDADGSMPASGTKKLVSHRTGTATATLTEAQAKALLENVQRLKTSFDTMAKSMHTTTQAMKVWEATFAPEPPDVDIEQQ